MSQKFVMTSPRRTSLSDSILMFHSDIVLLDIFTEIQQAVSGTLTRWSFSRRLADFLYGSSDGGMSFPVGSLRARDVIASIERSDQQSLEIESQGCFILRTASRLSFALHSRLYRALSAQAKKARTHCEMMIDAEALGYESSEEDMCWWWRRRLWKAGYRKGLYCLAVMVAQ